MIDTLAIIGVGLIGGSVGLAVRQRRLARRVIGVGPDPAALLDAQQQGIVDTFAPHAEALAVADFALICAPVDRIAGLARDAARHARPGTVLSDVGSTKAIIVRDATAALPEGVAFVGGHPIAGSQKSGHTAARADLFVGRPVVLTPIAPTPAEATARVQRFWEALGATVALLTPEEHDGILARTSHLPHIVASALAGITPVELLRYSGPGFRDTTRIAAGDPALWRAICDQNREPIQSALNDFAARIADFQSALDNDDAGALLRVLAAGKVVRDALDSDLPDERAFGFAPLAPIPSPPGFAGGEGGKT